MKNLSMMLLLVVLASCVSSRHIQAPEPAGFMVVLSSFHLSKTPEGFSIELTDLKKVNGSLKQSDTKPQFWMENDFYCLVVDQFHQVTDSIRIQQPLNPRYEFPEENGTIGAKQVELQQTDVLIRFPMRNKLRYLQLGIVGSKKKFKLIRTFDITSKI
jgi:hypothetical protein